jgi:amino acid transporter
MLLAAACFAELCIEYPVSGGAFSYAMVSLVVAGFKLSGGASLEVCVVGHSLPSSPSPMPCSPCPCLASPYFPADLCPAQTNFGELPAFLTLGGLLLEYALGMAAVARGFSRFLARLCNVSPTLFVVELWQCPAGYTVDAADVATNSDGARVQAPTACFFSHSFDCMAAGVVLLASVLLSLGARASALFISCE